MIPKVIMNLTMTNFKPAPCSLGDWSEWSGCSATCGQSVETRERQAVGDYAKWDFFTRTQQKIDDRHCDFLQVCPESGSSSSSSFDYY